jgi:hypothetical protein
MQKENWCAFCLAILYTDELTPEQAFTRLEAQRPTAYKYTNRFTRAPDADADVLEMIEMRASGLSYREIGAVFGISKDAVFKRILRSRPKCPHLHVILTSDITGGAENGENKEKTGG